MYLVIGILNSDRAVDAASGRFDPRLKTRQASLPAMNPATHRRRQRRYQTAGLTTDIPHGNAQSRKLIGGQGHPDFRYIGAKYASQHFARIDVLPEIGSLTLHPTLEGQIDLRALQICLCQRKCCFSCLQRRFSSRYLRLFQGQG